MPVVGMAVQAQSTLHAIAVMARDAKLVSTPEQKMVFGYLCRRLLYIIRMCLPDYVCRCVASVSNT